SKGEPLPGVGVKLKGTSLAVSTTAQGKYSINVPNTSGTLIFTSVGYLMQEIAVNGRSQVNASLQEDVAKLGEIVITGYGTQSRQTLTTSIAKLDTKTLENIPYSNALSAMQGSMPGVRVQSISGQPGSAPRVTLRGGTSINNSTQLEANRPLFLVDGVIRTNLNDIPADDIESLQVLKDAAATSIYGARASNGVVLVTTKSAKSGTTKISYSYDISDAKEMRMLDYVSAHDYIYYGRLSNLMAYQSNKIDLTTYNNRLVGKTGWGTGNDLTNSTAFTTQYLSAANAYKLNQGWESMPDPIDPTKTIIYKSTDFQDLRIQKAITQNHYLSASGGTDKAKYSASVGYMLADGTTITSFYNRLSANLNGSLQVLDNLKVDGRLIFSSADFGGPGTGAGGLNTQTNPQFGALSNMFYRNASMPSTTKYQFEDGTIAPGTGAATGNPHYYNIGPYAQQFKNEAGKINVNLNAKWDIVPGLSFEPLVSYYEENANGRTFQPAYLSGITTFTTSRVATNYANKEKAYQADALLTYVKSIGNHNFTGKAGYSYYKRISLPFSATGQGAGTDLIETLNASSTFTAASAQQNELVTEGVFGRITYDYSQRYLLEVTGRYDGASSLGANNQFAFFPGVGLGWNIHKETFWKSTMPTMISNFKLRATYGENGNIQGLGDYDWQGLYNVNGIQYNGAAGVVTNVLPNSALRWEKSRTLNGGLDLGLFNNRIGLTVEYFDRVTEASLTNVQLPTSSGYGSVKTNNGSVGNKGIEFDLSASVLPADSKLKWNLNFNASKVSTKVLELPFNGNDRNRQGGFQIYDPTTKSIIWVAGGQTSDASLFGSPVSFMEGSRIGDMYAFRQIGIYATDAEAALAPSDERGSRNVGNGPFTKYGGDVKWEDVNGDGIINNLDQVYVGNIFPKWTGGFSNYFNYKSFSLAVRTDFTTGHTIYNYARSVADQQTQGDLMPTQDFIDKSWKKQGDITNTPRYIYQVQGNVGRNSTYFEKGDFLCIREVSLGYNLPSDWARKIKLSSARLNLTGSNLYYFTNYTGPSPEEGGPEIGHYPVARTFTLGLNVTF
ncbi:MAG: SusC/RagA family TonB-linked outer membrane protein, partial [Pedobacter sp.]|nr:SusC/RagA family TonB-linked outer membrane protein [Pedobacter sp.]